MNALFVDGGFAACEAQLTEVVPTSVLPVIRAQSERR